MQYQQRRVALPNTLLAWLLMLWGTGTILFTIFFAIAISMFIYNISFVYYGLLIQGILSILAGLFTLRQKGLFGRWLLFGVALVDVALSVIIYFSPPSQPFIEILIGGFMTHAVIFSAVAFFLD